MIARAYLPELHFTIFPFNHSTASELFIFPISCGINPLPPLELSYLSFQTICPLFSMLCSLFFKNTRGGVCPSLNRGSK
jgi:hypothetical protein